MGLETGTECDIYFPAEETPITELEETNETPENPEIPETPNLSENNNSTMTTEEQNTGNSTNTSNEGVNSTATSSDGTTSTNSTEDLNPNKTNTTNSTDSKVSEPLNGYEGSTELVESNKKPNVAIIAAISGVIGALLVILGIVFLWRYSKRIRRTQTQPQRSKTWIKKPPKLTIPIKIIDDASNTSSAQHSPELSRTGSLRSVQDSPIVCRGSPTKARIVGHSRFRNYSPEVRDRRVVDDEQHQGFGLAIKPLGYHGTHGDEIDSPGIKVPRSEEDGGHNGFGLVLKPIEMCGNEENPGDNDVENPMNEAEIIHPETISIKSVPIISQEVKIEENQGK